MLPSFSFQRTFSVARKELLHIFRDPQTLFFTLVIPIVELFMLGYAIDTNVRHVRTVFVDYAGTQESRRLLEQFENSQDIRLVRRAYSQQEASQLIVAGEARIGIIIPQNYSERLQAGETAQILVLVDGTESSVILAASRERSPPAMVHWRGGCAPWAMHNTRAFRRRSCTLQPSCGRTSSRMSLPAPASPRKKSSAPSWQSFARRI